MREEYDTRAYEPHAETRTKDLCLSWLSFRNFRSYERFEISGIGDLTVFVGPNAAGKTNAIEGISLLTGLSSFRNPTAVQLVRWGSDQTCLRAGLASATRDLEVELSVREGKKHWLLNGKPKSAAGLRGLLPAVTFTPDDLDLVKGSSSGRRALLDGLGMQLAPSYGVIRRDYEKLIRHKNSLLKEDDPSRFDAGVLESINETLVTVGSQLFCYRAALFSRLISEAARFYGEITGGRETISGTYVPSWDVWASSHGNTSAMFSSEPAPFGARSTTALASAAGTSQLSRDEVSSHLRRTLHEALSAERRRGRALIGPHADAVEFLIDGASAREFGSQGQQRSIVLSVKLAEVALIRDMLDQRPVLLLDDVMSELDEVRRTALVRFISGDIQTFITTANLEYFAPELLSQARIVRIGKDPSNRSSYIDDDLARSAPPLARPARSSDKEAAHG